MRAAAASLPSFEVAIACRGAAFARKQNVRIHSQTHGAPRLTPFKPRFREDAMQSFFFSIPFHGLRARNDHGADISMHVISLNNARGSAQIFQARIRARSNEDTADADVFHGLARFQGHVLERLLGGATLAL